MNPEAPKPDPLAWLDIAACRGLDPDLFAPTAIGQIGHKRTSSPRELADIAEAKAVCARCTVGEACEADGTHDFWTIRNGKLPEERRPQAKSALGDALCGTDAGYRAHYRAGHRGSEVCTPCRDAHSEVRALWAEARRSA